MYIARLVGFAIAVIACVLTVVLLGPDEPQRFRPVDVTGNDELIAQAIADFESNSTNAGENLELQAIANGWVARDLLFVVATEVDALSQQVTILSAQTDGLASATEADDRVPILLTIGVATFVFHAVTASFLPSSRPQVSELALARHRDDEDEEHGGEPKDVTDEES